MKKWFRTITIIAFFNLFGYISFAQLQFGYVAGLDFYQRYTNADEILANGSSGSALLNLIAGPKIWIGGPEFSMSLEGQVNLGLFALDVKDYKGLGAVSFPLLAKFNFEGLTGMDAEFEWGVSFGGGIQWSKTELYYLDSDYANIGVERPLFPAYIIELGIGRGGFGLDGQIYMRYGFHPDTDVSVFNIGLVFDFVKTFDRDKAFEELMNKN